MPWVPGPVFGLQLFEHVIWKRLSANRTLHANYFTDTKPPIYPHAYENILLIGKIGLD